MPYFTEGVTYEIGYEDTNNTSTDTSHYVSVVGITLTDAQAWDVANALAPFVNDSFYGGAGDVSILGVTATGLVRSVPES